MLKNQINFIVLRWNWSVSKARNGRIYQCWSYHLWTSQVIWVFAATMLRLEIKRSIRVIGKLEKRKYCLKIFLTSIPINEIQFPSNIRYNFIQSLWALILYYSQMEVCLLKPLISKFYGYAEKLSTDNFNSSKIRMPIIFLK